VKKKTSNVPVFLIYAGIIHAIGLALLMPILITLPGPGGLIAPQPAAIDVEIIPAAPLTAKIEPGGEQTSALPSDAASAAPNSVEPDAGGEAVANVSPAGEMEEKARASASPVKEGAKPKVTAPAKTAKKPIAQRSRTAKPAVRRPAKTQTKIAPFNGALSGLFSPGAPANNRRR
jgi:hypothetical protein